MKKAVALFGLLGCYLISAAQSHTVVVEYQKISRDAVVNDIPFPDKTVTDAIQDTLEKLGYRGKEVKGYTVYKGVKIDGLGKDAYDLYFSVDKKSRKEKDIASVTMLISKGFDEFATDKTDPELMRNARTFMDSVRNTVAVYDLSQQISAQDDVVKKNEKKAAKLGDDADDLLKKKKKIEKEIEDNKKDQSDQAKEVEKQKQILETLKSQHKQ